MPKYSRHFNQSAVGFVQAKKNPFHGFLNDPPHKSEVKEVRRSVC